VHAGSPFVIGFKLFGQVLLNFCDSGSEFRRTLGKPSLQPASSFAGGIVPIPDEAALVRSWPQVFGNNVAMLDRGLGGCVEEFSYIHYGSL
jgi:hypothetical protein